jgi:hypothetical protein
MNAGMNGRHAAIGDSPFDAVFADGCAGRQLSFRGALWAADVLLSGVSRMRAVRCGQ